MRRAARIALQAGASVYVVHVSSEEGLWAVAEARAAGADVVAETCPQYLFLDAARLEDPPDGAQDYVCAPPVRGAPDREALWAGLGSGEIEVVATDHCPFTIADRLIMIDLLGNSVDNPSLARRSRRSPLRHAPTVNRAGPPRVPLDRNSGKSTMIWGETLCTDYRAW